MKVIRPVASRKLALAIALAMASGGPLMAADVWKHWRQGNGFIDYAAYPVQWDVETDARWRLELPGLGGSTPVVAGSKVYLTLGDGKTNHLLAVDAASGKALWRTDIGQDRGGKHKKGSGSNPSPTTDGEHVFVYYRSGDVGCVNPDGDIVWHRNLQEEFGEDTLWWDLGSSPVLTEDALVIAVMQSPPSPSYLIALDKKTGQTKWMHKRELAAPEEAAQSYTSPLAAVVDGRNVLAVLGADHLTVHDASNGEELGRLGGFNPGGEKFFRSIASPAISGNVILCPYARGATLTAVDMSKLMAGAEKDAILWQRDGLNIDVPTPAIHDGKVYLCQDRGQVLALDLSSGETLWELDLPRHRANYSSSPLVTPTHLYATREDGHVFVVKLPENAGEQGELVGESSLGDEEQFTVASPIPFGDRLMFRTARTLVSLGGEK